MGDIIANWMFYAAGIIYILLFGSITIWGARKVDDTLTVYLWKLIRTVRKLKRT